MKRTLAITVVLLWALCGGCSFRAPTVRPIVPAFDSMPGAPRPGNGRVVLDVVGARCRVRLATSLETGGGARIYQRDPDHVPTAILCVTPCQIELPRGITRLRFCEKASFDLRVSAKPSIFRADVRRHSRGNAVQWGFEPSAAAD